MVGFLERRVLDAFGLTDGQLLVDVGCGAGRLARYLTDLPHLRYHGTDVVPQVLEVAREECQRPDWSFVEVSDFVLPVGDGSADWVVFYSVFTNILPEDSYAYLQDGVRALKPKGRILASFMDLQSASPRRMFLEFVKTRRARPDPLVFIERTAMQFFAESLGLVMVALHPPGSLRLPVPPGTVLRDGRPVEGEQSFPQTLCVLEKP
jgi:ubiquinone/menaquinone biosynthesis C-methylase UbiE